MENLANIVSAVEQAGFHLSILGDEKIKAEPKSAITDQIRTLIRVNKPVLIEYLQDRAEAREERTAVLEYDHGFSRKEAETEAAKRLNFVTCGSCLHWEGNSPCGAGMVTSGDPIPGIAVRLCGFHTQKPS